MINEEQKTTNKTITNW